MFKIKKVLKLGTSIAVFSVLSSCSTTTAFDIAGSKADGTVVMGANIAAFGKVSWEGSYKTAKRRCKSWGYSSAEAFTGVRQKCISFSSYGCNRWELSRTYQCVGKLKPDSRIPTSRSY